MRKNKAAKPLAFIVLFCLLIALLPASAFAAADITVLEVTDSSAVITVTPSAAPHSYAIMLYWPNENPSAALPKYISQLSQAKDERIDGLTPGKAYSVKVTFYNTSGGAETVVETSATRSFETRQSMPVNIVGYPLPLGTGGVVVGVYHGVSAPTGYGLLFSSVNPNPARNQAGTYEGAIDSTGNKYGITAETTFIAKTDSLQQGYYYFRAYVTYNDGASGVQTVYSNVVAYSHSAPGSPQVITILGNKVGASVVMRGHLTNLGTGAVSEMGFVYSATNNIPSYENSSRVEGRFISAASSEFEGSFTTSAASGVYYVRAYAKNASGIGYGEVREVNLSSTSAYVLLQSKDYIGAQNAQFTIYVPNQALPMVLDKGVCIARDQGNVSIDGGVNVLVISAEKTEASRPGEYIVMAENLSRSTKYYIRAFIKTNTGTYYSSTVAEEFTTLSDERVVTSQVANITNNKAEITGKISANLEYTVQKRGVVYSSINSKPEIANSATVEHNRAETGDFTVELVGLQPDTAYYARAYILTVAGYEYSNNTRSFRTKTNTYLTIDGITQPRTGAVAVKAQVFGDANSAVLERGVTYMNEAGTKVTKAADTAGLGEYEVTLDGFSQNTTVEFTAYCRTSAGYFYSEPKAVVIEAITGVTVRYLTSDGVLVGEQTVRAPQNGALVPADLKIPDGYKLEREFSSMVISQNPINIVVVPWQEAKVEKPYTKGVGGYKFAPNEPMRRIDTFLMIYNLLGEGKTYSSAKIFPDMPVNYEEINAVNFMTSRGYVVGDGGMLYPERGLTRAEYATILCKAYNLMPNNSVNVNLTDISNHWSKTNAAIAVQNGVMTGYEDKTFRPDRQVTRAEAVVMTANAEKRALAPLGTTEFIDVKPSDWFYRAIMNAAIPEL